MLNASRLSLQVKANTLAPHQRPTSRQLMRHANYYERQMIKHPHRSAFHSESELLHAGLLEGDPTVISYIPQPFLLRVNGQPYTPDCYIVRQDGRREVIELKPNGVLDPSLQDPLEAFFSQQEMVFRVISNESVEARRTEAENWIEIVQNLYLARDFDTDAAELEIIECLAEGNVTTIGALSDPGDRSQLYLREIGLYRLLHRGVVAAELADKALDWDTQVQLCH